MAFVESPVQLLNVLEWAYATGRSGSSAPAPPHAPKPLRAGVPRQPDGRTDSRTDGRTAGGPAGEPGAPAAGGREDPPAPVTPPDTGLVIVVLAPHDPMTRGQLRRMAELARDHGHRLRWEEARGGPGAPLRTVAGLAGPLRRARRIVIGDPFSRYVQLLLPLTRARELVVVDDGTATMEFVSQLARGERLVRWHRRGSRGARDLAFAPVSASTRRRLTPNARRSVTVFTAMPVEAPPGVDVVRNDFAWTRAAFGPPRLTRGTDLVGTSLVETGVVDPERYLAAVAGLARAYGATRYFAHRRESTEKLHRIASGLGLEVVRPELPLELIARRGPIGRTVLSFPSTVVHTLPLALAGTGVTVAVCDIDPVWLTERASPRAEGFLSEVTDTASDVRRLPAMPLSAPSAVNTGHTPQATHPCG
ncbi:hypothetical protein AF335_27895 [Streptomyces eurocidicus]|uniref:Glycosyltransferase n=1 Tax=Streptomyces eurocidicus TaxID=66423 RepID=A0A2N8NPV3_STREU|nr:hypothetical protein [Streptomyces eurocidicus]MBF6050685.1 hypothetical protein [Streptomyces eurocidicus]PNE30802.1 hypothetical protein AF335_27895 [Streptomyces eurocidicus]